MPTHYEGTEDEKRALDAYIKLMRAANSVSERVTRHLVIAGITLSQMGVLEALYHLGPLSIGCLAQKHLKSPNNFTTVINNLEKKGFVRRERTETDRRVVLIHLTEAGQSALMQIFPGHVGAIVEEMSTLPSEELEQLGLLCRRLGRKEG